MCSGHRLTTAVSSPAVNSVQFTCVLNAAIAGSLESCYKISIAIKYSLNSLLPMKSRQSRGNYPPVMWHDRFSEQAWLHNDSFEGELNSPGFIFLHCVCLRSHHTRDSDLRLMFKMYKIVQGNFRRISAKPQMEVVAIGKLWLPVGMLICRYIDSLN